MNTSGASKEQELRRRVDALQKQVEERLGASVDVAQGAIGSASAVRSLAAALGVPPDRWTDAGAWDEALRNQVLHWLGLRASSDASAALAQAQKECSKLTQEAARLTQSLSEAVSGLEKVQSELSPQSEQMERLRSDLNALADALGRAEALLGELERRVAQMEEAAAPISHAPSPGP